MLDTWGGSLDCFEDSNRAVNSWIKEILLGVLDGEVKLKCVRVNWLR